MLSIMAQNRRRGWQISRKKTGEALAETVFSRNFVTLSPILGHNWKHDLARSCFILKKNKKNKKKIHPPKKFSPKKLAPKKCSPKRIFIQKNFSIKHDLARSCFQLWPKIGDEGDKISRKKTGKALAEIVFIQILYLLNPNIY